MDILQQEIEVKGARLYCERAGQGEPLILLHGGGGDRRHWDGQFEKLAATHDVVRYDLRGYGRSDPPVEAQVYRHEDDLSELMGALDIPQAHIAGYSLGSQIAVDSYTVYPQLFRSLIIVGPYVSGYSSPASDHLFSAYLALGQVFVSDGADAAAEGFANIPAFNPDRISSGVKTRIIRVARDYGWWWARLADPMQAVTPQAIDILDDIDVPVLVVTAEHDAAVCREVADVLCDTIGHAERVDMAGATHFMLMEKPDILNEAIRNFTRTPPGRPV